MEKGGYRKSDITNKQLDNLRQNVIRLQKQHKLTNGDLAELCGVSAGTISNLRCGCTRPSRELIDAISNALYVDKKSLLMSEDDVEKREKEVWRKRLIAARNEKNLSVVDVAAMMNIEASMIKELERGETYWPEGPSRDKLEGILGIGSAKKKVTKSAGKEPATGGTPKNEASIPAEDKVSSCTYDIPDEIVGFIIDHVKDFKAPTEKKREVLRTFLEIQNRRLEEKLLGACE